MKQKGMHRAKRSSELAVDAALLKKAWVIATLFAGSGDTLRKQPQLLEIRDLSKWPSAKLRTYVDDLTDDFIETLKPLLADWERTDLRQKVQWFADHYDGWRLTLHLVSPYDFGRLHDLEAALGPLRIPDEFDFPPYSLILLQGFSPPAFRHPEYHLGTDIALLFDLLVDAEVMSAEDLQAGLVHRTEHNQSLARVVILTCFNLLEAFSNGLTEEWILKNPSAPAEQVKKLRQNRGGVGERLLKITELFTARSDAVDVTKPPYADLFGDCKERRDSFVHCEPGGHSTTRGNYIKEQRFHDATVDTARTTVELTFELIKTIWSTTHGKQGPSWLPKKGENGRYRGVEVCLKKVAGG